MLKLTLDWAQSQAASTHPFLFLPTARWYAEALLPSPFLSRHRGDALAENWTNADGVIGHFDIGNVGKGDLHLRPDASQLVVVEAKLFSPLSNGTTNAPGFHQAARSVSCIAQVLAQANRRPEQLERLAFYVVAPEAQIQRGIFGGKVTNSDIEARIKQRIEAYQGEKDAWLNEWFLPTLNAITISLISWEMALADAEESYWAFYKRCLAVAG